MTAVFEVDPKYLYIYIAPHGMNSFSLLLAALAILGMA